jgi:adenylate cyclase
MKDKMNLSETLFAYMPQDRRESTAAGDTLPGQTQGTALWADLSGFTSLTEILASKLGARRGAEELALQLNRFYDALITQVEAYGGSVVSFSGDAITCWFDSDDGRRAVSAAWAMQTAMQPFISLQLMTGDTVSISVKIAVASGPIRRLQVGDPNIQTLDILVGSTLERLSAIGHLAGNGELLVDETTQTALAEWLQISKRRANAIVVSGLSLQLEPSPKVALPDLTEEQLRPWLLPAVFTRLQAGQGEFLTELRPAAALFMRFEGLDYDGDEQVGEKLDTFICQVQGILEEYEGTLLQLTIDDKGSYLYIAFGALVAHENDVIRAVTAALALSQLPTKLNSSIQTVSIGLSRGVMRTGAYGSSTRRTYGVLGDEVNLAARLMQRAAPRQILASESIWQATPHFNWQLLPALEVRGKYAIVTPAILLGRLIQKSLHILRATTGFPMVGRQAELALIEEKLAMARQGQGQVVSVIGEAGMGKSRLLAEVLQQVRANGLTIYGGECQSYGIQSSYLVWHSIWQAFFGLDSMDAPSKQIETVEKVLKQINPDFLLRMPLLGIALNLSIPNNGLTSAMEARTRKTLGERLLLDCLRARAAEGPLVLVLEDLHWMDPLSRDLLALITQAIKDLPIFILLAYRPSPQATHEAPLLPDWTNLEYVIEIALIELSRTETEQLVLARLKYFGLESVITSSLLERILTRTQGNPFYIEELLNYLRDRGLDPLRDDAWEQADLPDSLHRLILSRIDQLGEHQQITIKAASVIGRLFRAAWLYGYYPTLGGPEQVFANLEILSRLEFTALETPEPDLAYLFKHVITQEAAYESLAYATRSTLHEKFAQYLELAAGENLEPFLDLLAYHYEHSENLPKKREYLFKAGEAAQKAHANEAALSYLGRALALAPETDHAGRFAILSMRELIYQFFGEREAQKQDLTNLSALAETLDDNQRAQAALQRSRYAMSTSNFPEAIAAAQQAVKLARMAHKEEKAIRAYWLWGRTLWLQGSYAKARTRYKQALVMAETAKLTAWIATTLDGLGSLDIYDGNYDRAQHYLERALQLSREMGDREREATCLYNLGEIADLRGNFAQAQAYHEQALHFFRLIGMQINEGRSLSRVGSMIVEQRGDYEKAELYTRQALHISQKSKDGVGEIGALYGLSLIDLAQNNYQAARVQAERGLRICRDIGFKYFEGMCLTNLGTVADELGEYASALEYHQQGLSILRKIGEPSLTSHILAEVAKVFCHLGDYKAALEYNQQALAIAKEKIKLAQTRILISQGHTLNRLGDLNQAASFYQQVLHLTLELSLPDCYTKQAQAGLADIALAQGNLAGAQAPLNEIVNYLKTRSVSSIDEIFWIYLTCYRILQASSDLRARPTLQAAHTLLQEIAATIDDESLRISFLKNVRVNREIVQTWQNIL